MRLARDRADVLRAFVDLEKQEQQERLHGSETNNRFDVEGNATNDGGDSAKEASGTGGKRKRME